MSSSGDDADRVARSDAGGGEGGLRGPAFKAGATRPAPQRASRWANSAVLAAVCIFVVAVGWRQQAAQASERAPERVQERVRPEASDQPPVRRADAAPAADRNMVLTASAGAEPAPTRQMPAPTSDDRPERVRAARGAVPVSAAGEAGYVEPPAPSQATGPEAARLLMERADIVTARAAFERAVESGSPIAAFALVEIYDPVVLSAWGAVGTQGDPAKAQPIRGEARR